MLPFCQWVVPQRLLTSHFISQLLPKNYLKNIIQPNMRLNNIADCDGDVSWYLHVNPLMELWD